MTRDWVGYIVEEAEELLGAGRVGLYEFLEFLKDTPSAPPESERTAIAQQALDRLLQLPEVRLFWMKWASDYREPADGATPTAADWQTPTEKPYLAVDTV